MRYLCNIDYLGQSQPKAESKYDEEIVGSGHLPESKSSKIYCMDGGEGNAAHGFSGAGCDGGEEDIGGAIEGADEAFEAEN